MLAISTSELNHPNVHFDSLQEVIDLSHAQMSAPKGSWVDPQ